MKFNSMDWVHWLLLICISFTCVNSSSIRPVENRETYNFDEDFSEGTLPSQSKSKRSVDSNLNDDINSEDLMSVSVRNTAPYSDSGVDSNTDSNYKRSTVDCAKNVLECATVQDAADDPAYVIDFSIGNETPIAMEHLSELTAEGKQPEDTFNGQSSMNLVIKQPSSNVGLANVTHGVTRKKRESTRFENINDSFMSEITSMVENEHDKLNHIGARDDAAIDASRQDDLMTTEMHQESDASIVTPFRGGFSDEHISRLSAKASSPQKKRNSDNNYNTLKKELIAEVEMMKKATHSNEKRHKVKKVHKKHGEQVSARKGLIRQRTSPVANHRHSELTAKSSSPRDEIKRSKNSKISKRSRIDSTNGELKSIFSEMHTARHKLTRSDIRKLAKTAVMLAALKSQRHSEEENAERKHSVSKSKHNKGAVKKKKVSRDKKKSKKSKTKETDHVEDISTPVSVTHGESLSDRMSFNTKDSANQPEFSVTFNRDKAESTETNLKHDKGVSELDINVEQQINEKKNEGNGATEFTEDIIAKKSNNTGVSDDAMVDMIAKSAASEEMKRSAIQTTPEPASTSDTTVEMTTTKPPTTVAPTTTAASLTTATSTTLSETTIFPKELSLKVVAEGSMIQKKSVVSRPDDDIEKAISDFDTNDLYAMTDSTDSEKKSSMPSREVSDNMASLKAVLNKVNAKKVPSKFLPDLPAGLRMIAWKKLIEKKRSQLAEYESVVGGTEVATETDSDKPVTINIDLDTHKSQVPLQDVDISYAKANDEDKLSFAKSSPVDNAQTERIKDLERTVDESSNFMTSNDDEDGETARHVHYLKKHIQGARSLRKLIAKTLVGHCKSTGKRILSAFIAMDKALERAQAIATVIGGKFNVNPDKIDNLVTDKEDQVVETFLRDIFTKL